MKKILLIGLFLLSVLPARAQYHLDQLYEDIDAFLSEHVQDGLVDYKSIQADPADLQALLQRIEHADWKKFDALDQQAFLINAYNLLVIAAVVNHYPIHSPLDVDGFFNTETHMVGGQSVTLDQLEKQILFPTFGDPRFHFALVCAAKGCPILIDRAYRGSALDTQLETRTRLTLSNPIHVRIDEQARRVDVTQLFEWYADDFTTNDRSILQYINQYRDQAVPEDYSLGYIDYDWQLNDSN